MAGGAQGEPGGAAGGGALENEIGGKKFLFLRFCRSNHISSCLGRIGVFNGTQEARFVTVIDETGFMAFPYSKCRVFLNTNNTLLIHAVTSSSPQFSS